MQAFTLGSTSSIEEPCSYRIVFISYDIYLYLTAML